MKKVQVVSGETGGGFFRVVSSEASNRHSFFGQERQPVKPQAVVEKQAPLQSLDDILQIDFSVAAKQVREHAATLSKVDVGLESELLARKCAAAADSFERIHRKESLLSRDYLPFHLLYGVLLIMCSHRAAFPNQEFEKTEACIEDLANLALDKQEAAVRRDFIPRETRTIQDSVQRDIRTIRGGNQFSRELFGEELNDASQGDAYSSGPAMCFSNI